MYFNKEFNNFKFYLTLLPKKNNALNFYFSEDSILEYKVNNIFEDIDNFNNIVHNYIYIKECKEAMVK